MANILLNFRMPLENTTVQQEVPLAMTVAELARSLQRMGRAGFKLRLLDAGEPLDEHSTIENLQLEPGSTLTVLQTDEPDVEPTAPQPAIRVGEINLTPFIVPSEEPLPLEGVRSTNTRAQMIDGAARDPNSLLYKGIAKVGGLIANKFNKRRAKKKAKKQAQENARTAK